MLLKSFSALAALKGQWPFLKFLAVVDSINTTIGVLAAYCDVSP